MLQWIHRHLVGIVSPQFQNVINFTTPASVTFHHLKYSVNNLDYRFFQIYGILRLAPIASTVKD